jgi:hypothetical protein
MDIPRVIISADIYYTVAYFRNIREAPGYPKELQDYLLFYIVLREFLGCLQFSGMH